MPTDDGVSSPLGDEQLSEQLPPASPQHVFDDDVENDIDMQPHLETQPTAAPSAADDDKSAANEPDPQTETEAPVQTSAQPSTPHDEDDDVEQNESEPSSQSSLFEKILHKPARAPSLVSAWMSHVSINGPEAMASLVSLAIGAARPVPFAHEQLVTPDMIIANDPPSSVNEMCQVMAVDAPERVAVLAKDTASRRVRRAYEDFWRRTAAEASEVVLYHTDCFDTLIPWLDAMSSSPIRALRVSACLAAYRLVDGFIEVNSQLRKHLASIQRQLNTEKRRSGINVREPNSKSSKSRPASGKGRKKELSAKGKELANKLDELTAKNGELTELSDRVYRTMFICRYRDISGDLRSLSISALGGWIIMFPEQFLDDTHNKYIGWLLSDKDANVRKTSLDVLHRMLKKKDYFANFETFLQRFSDRILEMAWDKDDVVAITAIRLLNFLLPLNNNSKLLRPSHCESISAIALGDNHTEIRRAAGEFLATLVTMDIDGASVAKPKHAYKKRGRPRSSGGPFNTLLREIPSVERSKDDIKELLYAIARKEDETVDEALTVDAVWDHLPALRCWKAFEELLIESPESRSTNEDEESLTDAERSTLCRILLASAAEASGNGDSNRAKIVEKGEYGEPETPSVLLSKQFLPQLPRLLNQYQSDSSAVCALIELPRHFTMSTFEQQGQDSYFSTLLERVIGVLLKHTGSEKVTTACAETLRYFLSDQNPLKKTTCTALQLCCQRATKDLALQVRADLSKAEPDNIAALILQVRVLAELVDTDFTTYETVKEVLLFQENNVDSSELGPHVTFDAVRAACAFAEWINANLSQTYQRTMCPNHSDTLSRNRKEHGNDDNSWTQRDPGNTMAAPDVDILNLKDSVPDLVEAMRSVVFRLVETELEQHRSRTSRRSRNPSIPDETDRRDFFACLVQASLQSLLSRSISYLPLFGVLLKADREERGSEVHEYTSSRVCRDYLQQRQVRRTALTQDIIRALGEVAVLHCPKDEHQNLIRELAESCVSFPYRRDLKAKASTELLRALMDFCSSSTTEADFVDKLQLLSSASFAVVGGISQEDGQKAIAHFSAIDDQLLKYKGAVSEDLEKSLEICRSMIKDVAAGKTPDVPSFSKLTDRPASGRSGHSRRRKRRLQTPKAHTPPPQPANVRKSSRVRKRVDYARMEIYDSDEIDDEEEPGAEEGEEDASPSEPTVADVARDIMEYQNSPVALRKRPSREVPSADLSPTKKRKRGTDAGYQKGTADSVSGNERRNQPSFIHGDSRASHISSAEEAAEHEQVSQHDEETSPDKKPSPKNSDSEVGGSDDVKEPENQPEQAVVPQRRHSRKDSTSRQSEGKQNGRQSRRNGKSGSSDGSLKEAPAVPKDDERETVEEKKSPQRTSRRTRSSRRSASQQPSAKSDLPVNADETPLRGKENMESTPGKGNEKPTPKSKESVVRRRQLRRW
ncbi:Cohesin subunit Scc3/SA [Gracilaria domingensis]|nr:Cohesin subunit Scc3/SA [Gracilaria domingensis]